MIAGPPNGGKSLLAQWYCMKSNCRTMYFSADTDDYTFLQRGIAMATGEQMSVVEQEIAVQGVRSFDKALGEYRNLQVCFEPSPTLDDIDAELRAFEEIHGEPPELIVIDNLMNVLAEHDNEFSGMREISKALHHVARVTGAGVLVLHHTSESEGIPGKPQARRAVMGKVNQLPEVILTVAMEPSKGLLHVAVVKNRSGPHDPTGNTYTTLFCLLDRMQLFDDRQAAWAAMERGTYQ